MQHKAAGQGQSVSPGKCLFASPTAAPACPACATASLKAFMLPETILGMVRIDCSGNTRLAMHVPSSHELEIVNIIVIMLHELETSCVQTCSVS